MMTEHNYWETRYQQRTGSEGRRQLPAREWQWRHILAYIPDLLNTTILDVGCGDLELWRGHTPSRYTGLDISETIQVRNRLDHPSKVFETVDASLYDPDAYHVDTVLCLNVLYHVMTKDRYNNLLRNINHWAQKHVVLYTWHSEPSYPYIRTYQRYTPPDWTLLSRFTEIDRIPQYDHASLYIFQRKEP